MIQIARSMKAISYKKYGPPEVLKLLDLSTPVPKKNEVLIQVCAVEVTKSDCELRSFKFPVKWFWLPLRLAFGVFSPKRNVLGGYFSGVVVALGKNAKKFAIGDEVYGCAKLKLGAYAEYIVLPETYSIAKKPQKMSFIDSASAPLGGLNALHFMRLAEIQPGENILINGAGGSIGAHALQIAKFKGLKVTAVDHSNKESFLRRLGADHFIDYKVTNVAISSEKYDVIFDMVVNSSYSGFLNLLNPRGRYLSGNPRLSVILRSFLTNLFTKKVSRVAIAQESVEELEELATMIDRGEIVSIVDRIMPMEDVIKAHHLVETEQRLGAIVISIQQ